MSNTIITNDIVAREGLAILEGNLVFAKFVNRSYDESFGNGLPGTGAKQGDAVRLRLPAKYTVGTGASVSTQDVTQNTVSLTLDTQANIGITLTSKERSLDVANFSEYILKPAIAAISNKVDADGLALYSSVYNQVGTPGTVPTTFLTYGEAGQKLDDTLTPRDGLRSVVISPAMNTQIVDANKALLNDPKSISKQYTQGTMGQALGFKFSMDQNVASHTSGAQGGTPLVNGASQTGDSLITDGWSDSITGVVKKGDVFTIASVYAVHPVSKANLGYLQQFVVTADKDSDSSGNATLAISPSIVTSGAFQNVSAGPADNAAITLASAASTTGRVALAFHRDAFILATADLMLPGVKDEAYVRSSQLNMGLRAATQWQVSSDALITRLDTLYGWLCCRPELACRIAS